MLCKNNNCRGFLSTPSARRATDNATQLAGLLTISIHALREEGDASDVVKSSSGEGFLSTPSARRATKRVQSGYNRFAISIHALREEGDLQAVSPQVSQ